jgi:putative transcriptional regulator
MTEGSTSIFDELKTSLEDSIAFSQGELSLVTTTIPTPPPRREPAQIADLRHRLRMSQAVFAAVINVSPKTVQSWEQGVRRPSQAALRMLEVIDEDPGVVKIIMTPKTEPALRSRTGFAEPVR